MHNLWIATGCKRSAHAPRGRAIKGHADVLLRSVSRNNLWVHTFLADNNFGGFMWDGQGDAYQDNQDLEATHGQSHADWKTDLDYDALDWVTRTDAFQQGLSSTDTTTTDLVLRWGSVPDIAVGHPVSKYFSFSTADPHHSAEAWLTGWAGGPSNGDSCSSSGVECGSYKRAIPESNWQHLRRDKIFLLDTDTKMQDCSLDVLACQSADAQSCCAIDMGDADFFQRDQFYLREAPDGKPDLGAYEHGQPSLCYGPRNACK